MGQTVQPFVAELVAWSERSPAARARTNDSLISVWVDVDGERQPVKQTSGALGRWFLRGAGRRFGGGDGSGEYIAQQCISGLHRPDPVGGTDRRRHGINRRAAPVQQVPEPFTRGARRGAMGGGRGGAAPAGSASLIVLLVATATALVNALADLIAACARAWRAAVRACRRTTPAAATKPSRPEVGEAPADRSERDG
jgi:hypothetical protein